MTTLVSAGNERLAGSRGVWIFVFIDMLVFALIFSVFMSERASNVDVFRHSQLFLDVRLALANTIILLTSSLWYVTAIGHATRGEYGKARRDLILVILAGLLFAGFKVFEYHVKLAAGITVVSNGFFTFYYFITFVHLLHVVGGMMFIGLLLQNGIAGQFSLVDTSGMESLGLFWHYVDLLWVFIFAMLYLLP